MSCPIDVSRHNSKLFFYFYVASEYAAKHGKPPTEAANLAELAAVRDATLKMIEVDVSAVSDDDLRCGPKTAIGFPLHARSPPLPARTLVPATLSRALLHLPRYGLCALRCHTYTTRGARSHWCGSPTLARKCKPENRSAA